MKFEVQAPPCEQLGLKSRRTGWRTARIADSSSRKRSQLFIRTHSEPLSVAAMRIGNEDCWPAGRDHIMISALVS
jgi:hypothetical protein